MCTLVEPCQAESGQPRRASGGAGTGSFLNARVPGGLGDGGGVAAPGAGRGATAARAKLVERRPCFGWTFAERREAPRREGCQWLPVFKLASKPSEVRPGRGPRPPGGAEWGAGHTRANRGGTVSSNGSSPSDTVPVAATPQTRLEAVRDEVGAGGTAGQCAQVCPRTHSRRRARGRARPLVRAHRAHLGCLAPGTARLDRLSRAESGARVTCVFSPAGASDAARRAPPGDENGAAVAAARRGTKRRRTPATRTTRRTAAPALSRSRPTSPATSTSAAQSSAPAARATSTTSPSAASATAGPRPQRLREAS